MHKALTKIFLSTLVWFSALVSYGQTATISGTVLDDKTGSPLLYANVFISHTTIGTTTNERGDFLIRKLDRPAVVELVVSFVGYKTYNTRIKITEEITALGIIRLMPDEKLLGALEVSGSRDKQWEKNLKRFKEIFLGDDAPSGACTITNPWVIDFGKEAGKMKFTASARDPIEIINTYLGYKVSFYLTRFQASRTNYLIAGNVRFDELNAATEEEREKWRKNRNMTYAHSKQHLFKAMVHHRIHGEGFNVYREFEDADINKTRSPFFEDVLGTEVTTYDTTQLVSTTDVSGIFKLNIPTRMEVHYRGERPKLRTYRDIFWPVSWITVNEGVVWVNRNGLELNPEMVSVSGAMSEDRIPHLLPTNYLPDSPSTTPNNPGDTYQQLYEKIYVHTDRPYYYSGETIWLKGYINYASWVLSDSLSQTVYVDLLKESDGAHVLSRIYHIDSGGFHGNLLLPQNLPPSQYVLRAYTSLGRNFGDANLFQRPVPVLALTDRVRYVAPEVRAGEEQLRIRTDQAHYKPREKITIEISLPDAEDQFANLSIAVTDSLQVIPIQTAPDIQEVLPIAKDGIPVFQREFKYPLDNGIRFRGRFVGAGTKPRSELLHIFQLSPKHFSMAWSDEQGVFTVSDLSFYDTATFLVKPALANAATLGRAQSLAPDVPALQPMINRFTIFREETNSPRRIWNDSIAPSTMLKEVAVTAKKIPQEYQPEFRLRRPFGTPGYVIQGKNLNTAMGNLLLALPGKFPGLIVRMADNAGPDGSNGDGPHYVVYTLRSATSSMKFVPEVTVMVNDQFVGGTPEQILSAINPDQVESVELKTGINVMYGSRSAGGILSVYLKDGSEASVVSAPDSIQNVIRVGGYSRPAVFKSPQYDQMSLRNQVTDYRSLIYWNPSIRVRSSQPTRVSFFASDFSGRYTVVVEGVTRSGMVSKRMSIVVKQDDQR
jgi:hypothetical protein